MMKPRRFPAPWSAEETEACFIVKDSGGQKLAYIYFEDEPGRRSAAKLLAIGLRGLACHQTPRLLITRTGWLDSAREGTMSKLIAVTAFLCLVTSSAFAFDVAKCNQHCAESCSGKGPMCSINCAHRCNYQGGRH
jgi:hypothetical protein